MTGYQHIETLKVNVLLVFQTSQGSQLSCKLNCCGMFMKVQDVVRRITLLEKESGALCSKYKFLGLKEGSERWSFPVMDGRTSTLDFKLNQFHENSEVPPNTDSLVINILITLPLINSAILNYPYCYYCRHCQSFYSLIILLWFFCVCKIPDT